MQQMTKRWLSLLLAAVLCVSAGGVPALAAEIAEADSGISTLPSADGPAVTVGEPSDSQPADGNTDTEEGGNTESGGGTDTNGGADTGEEGGNGSQEPAEPSEPGTGDNGGSETGGDNGTAAPSEGENGNTENGSTENGSTSDAPADEENKPAVKTEDTVPDGFFTNIEIGKDYKDGAIVPFKGDIKADADCAVLFNYTVPEGGMTVGTKYTFTVKAPLIADAKFTIQAYDDEGNLIEVADGELAKQSAGECAGWVKFRDGMEAYCEAGVQGYFYVGAKFDKEEIGTGGRKELDIVATGGFTIKEELDFEIPQITAGVNLNKDCHGYAYMADHKIQWILKATPWINNADEINSLVITDPIPDTMSYDESNAEPKAVLKDGKTEVEGTFTYDEETRTLKFEGSGNSLKKESWPITITFFANYDVNNLPKLNNKGEAKFTNTAHAEITAPQFEKKEDGTIEKVDGKITPDNTKDATADAEKSSWITCMYLDKGGSLRNGNTVHWTITATNGMSQKNPKLVDKLPAHMKLSSEVTLKIGDTTKTLTEGSDYTLSYDDAAHQYTMTILLDTTTTTAQIVEYDTVFDGDSGEDVKKIAEVINNVDFVVGDSGHEQTIHKQGKVHIGNVLMTKTGQYDAKTHRIKWTVVLRTDGQALENIVVTDTFAQKIGSIDVAQTYVPGSMYLNGNISLDPSNDRNYDLEVAADGKSFKLKVAKQHSNNDILTYETELEDSENGHGFWGTNYTKNNGKFKIYNYLTMDADGLPDQAEVKISGATDGWSNVLQKWAGDYDAAKHEIVWTIKVNQNQMKLTNGIIKDVLTDNNWAFVEDEGSVTAKVGGKTVTLHPTFDQTEGENGLPRMTISLPDMAEGEGPMEITYRTKLVSNDPLLSNKTFNAKNVATLTGDQIPEGGVTVSADKTVGQTVLSKKLESTKLNAKNELVWTVDVNRNLANITALGNIGIEDVLQQGLVYVAGTLKVNRLTINKDGSDTVGTALTEGKDYTVEYDSVNRKLTLTWLKNTLANEAYRVTFNTRVLVSGSYSNTVRFTGFGEDGKHNSSVTDRLVTFGGGWTSIPQGMGNLEIVKLDGTSNKPLAGVEFGLYEKKDDGTEEFYGSFKTDKDGKITAQLPFGTWIVHEITPLNGYALPSVNEWTYKIDSRKTYSQTVKNYKPNEFTTFQPEVTKAVTGAGAPSGQTFCFELTGANADTPMTSKNTVSITDNGTVKFGEIQFTQLGTYTYTIKEINGGADHFTYDDKAHTLAVEIGKDAEGNLKVVSAKYDGEDSLTITNHYQRYVKYAPVVTKNVKQTGPIAAPDETFAFMLAAAKADAQKMPSETTVSAKANETAKFGEIEFNEPGEYKFTITETKGTTPYMTYDEKAHVLIVNVKANDDGTLAVESVKYDDADSLTVTNEYHEFIEYTPEVTKKVDGYNVPKDRTFEFEIKADPETADAPLPEKDKQTASVKDEGAAKFGAIEFNKAGTYKYILTEKYGGERGFTYDTAEHHLTVIVTKDAATGKLNLTAKYDDDQDSLTITNKYKKPSSGGGGGTIKPDPTPDPKPDPDPDKPVDPTEPDKPTDPDQPSNPDKPSEPDKPTPPHYPIDKVPDPNEPDAPDPIIIDDEDIPKGEFHIKENPDGTFEYVDEDDVPLSEWIERLEEIKDEDVPTGSQEPAEQTSRGPKTGTPLSIPMMLLIALVCATGAAALTLFEKKKYK